MEGQLTFLENGRIGHRRGETATIRLRDLG